MSRSTKYTKVKNTKGIYLYKQNGQYMAEKRIKGKLHIKTFASLFDAKQWQKKFDGTQASLNPDEPDNENYSTLKEVWEKMQEKHFPILATSTKQIWRRRYELLQCLEHLPMNKITPTKITEWVMKQVDFKW